MERSRPQPLRAEPLRRDPPHATPPPPPPAPRRPRWRRPGTLRRLALVTLTGLAVALVGGSVLWERCGIHGCPDVRTLTSYTPDGAPVLLDASGEPFAELKPAGQQVVELGSLPDYVGEAFIAVEDRRFRQHHGIDWPRVGGALLANLRAHGVEEGSSTITMQLARNLFPDRIPGSKRTLSRKLLEMRVAKAIEHRFSKDQILELYLNYIYFGGGARGIDAASHLYFDEAPEDLTLPQAALLAALPKAPSNYDPRRHPKRAKERRDLVLELMADQGRIEPEKAEHAREAKLGVSRESRLTRGEVPFAPYFVEEVRRQLEERFGDAIYTEPLRIRTTLDRTAQKAAEETLENQLERIERGVWGRFRGTRYAAGAAPEEVTRYLQGAVVVLSAETGDVLAWVGGRDFVQSRFDRVEDARRQVGSAFKPFVYATALAQGHPLSERLIDRPLEIPLDRRHTWSPKNFSGRFQGSVSMRDALVSSKNVPTVRLAQEVGTVAVARTARDFGLPDDRVPRTPSMALGTATLSPLEMATAYTAFANLGSRVEPRLLLEVARPDGEVLWTSDVDSHRVVDPAVAFLVTDALEDAVRRGTGARVRTVGFRGPAAGKTGTTNDRRDAWFVGYTPDLVGAVWIGFDTPRPIVPGAQGGHLAAPVWGRMMRRIYRERPTPAAWKPPGDVVRRAVDPATGLLLAANCQPVGAAARHEFFLVGTEPQTICPSSNLPQGGGVLDEGWRSAFHAWIDGWNDTSHPEGGAADGIVVDADGDGEGIRMERQPDGTIRLQNTGPAPRPAGPDGTAPPGGGPPAPAVPAPPGAEPGAPSTEAPAGTAPAAPSLRPLPPDPDAPDGEIEIERIPTDRTPPESSPPGGDAAKKGEKPGKGDREPPRKDGDGGAAGEPAGGGGDGADHAPPSPRERTAPGAPSG